MCVVAKCPELPQQEHTSWVVHPIADGVTITATVRRKRRKCWSAMLIGPDFLERTVATSYHEAREYVDTSMLRRLLYHQCGDCCDSYRMASLSRVAGTVEERVLTSGSSETGIEFSTQATSVSV